ncbi:MAG TPA: RidA family protein [Candidatus Limnocylindrales bacterium]|nr:RidA family protein [Candidatus Limnocylindrales bacterium]
MRKLLLAMAGVVGIAAVVWGGEFRTPKQQTVETQKARVQEGKPFRIFNPETMAKPTVGYSQVAEVGEGKIVYIAGQVALDKSGNLVGKDDFRAQAQQVFENLKAAVEATGGDFNSVIKLNIYCSTSVDPAQLPVLREVRDKYVNTANPPTSTLVFVQRLVRSEWMIEVDAVAVVKK